MASFGGWWPVRKNSSMNRSSTKARPILEVKNSMRTHKLSLKAISANDRMQVKGPGVRKNRLAAPALFAALGITLGTLTGLAVAIFSAPAAPQQFPLFWQMPNQPALGTTQSTARRSSSFNGPCSGCTCRQMRHGCRPFGRKQGGNRHPKSSSRVGCSALD